MFSRLSRLRLLSVLLTLVLVAPPLGGRLSDRPAAQAASSQPSATTNRLEGVACLSPSTCRLSPLEIAYDDAIQLKQFLLLPAGRLSLVE